MLATLLPHHWFLYHLLDASGHADVAGPWWHTLVLLVITGITMTIVIKGADLLVEGAAGVAKRLGMPEVVIGATIVSLGTTSPEMAVSVLAAWAGNAGLALGNGVGSIIADTGLILGVGMLLTSLPADRFVLSRQGWVQFGAPLLLTVICYALYAIHGNAAQIGRPIGLLLVALLVAYMAISVRWAKRHPHGEPHGEGDPHLPKPDGKPLAVLLAVGLVGLVMVILAGDALVQAVTILAARVGIPDVVIASTLVALGTSLPELVVGITAIRKGHPELLVGNIIGADILNILFVIGLAALAKPLPIIDNNPGVAYPAIFLQLQLPMMMLMLVIVRGYIFKATREGRFARWMGAPLVALYAIFIIAAAVLS